MQYVKHCALIDCYTMLLAKAFCCVCNASALAQIIFVHYNDSDLISFKQNEATLWSINGHDSVKLWLSQTHALQHVIKNQLAELNLNFLMIPMASEVELRLCAI